MTQRLSARTRRRDEEYTAFAATRLPALRRLALLCQDWQRADDLVQSAITSLYMHWDTASGADHPDAYARAVLIREFLHERRSGWARRAALGHALPETAAAGPDSDDQLDLRAAVASLPPRQRATLVLRYYCDLSLDQEPRCWGARRARSRDINVRGKSKGISPRQLLARHLRLLGPDPAHWTREPMG